MSSPRASTAATVLHATSRPEQVPVGGRIPVQDSAASERALATRLQPPQRANTPTPVNPRWHSVAHCYDDPCNYLG
jgi:hypothetical protein